MNVKNKKNITYTNFITNVHNDVSISVDDSAKNIFKIEHNTLKINPQKNGILTHNNELTTIDYPYEIVINNNILSIYSNNYVNIMYNDNSSSKIAFNVENITMPNANGNYQLYGYIQYINNNIQKGCFFVSNNNFYNYNADGFISFELGKIIVNNQQYKFVPIINQQNTFYMNIKKQFNVSFYTTSAINGTLLHNTLLPNNFKINSGKLYANNQQFQLYEQTFAVNGTTYLYITYNSINKTAKFTANNSFLNFYSDNIYNILIAIVYENGTKHQQISNDFILGKEQEYTSYSGYENVGKKYLRINDGIPQFVALSDDSTPPDVTDVTISSKTLSIVSEKQDFSINLKTDSTTEGVFEIDSGVFSINPYIPNGLMVSHSGSLGVLTDGNINANDTYVLTNTNGNMQWQQKDHTIKVNQYDTMPDYLQNKLMSLDETIFIDSAHNDFINISSTGMVATTQGDIPDYLEHKITNSDDCIIITPMEDHIDLSFAGIKNTPNDNAPDFLDNKISVDNTLIKDLNSNDSVITLKSTGMVATKQGDLPGYLSDKIKIGNGLNSILNITQQNGSLHIGLKSNVQYGLVTIGANNVSILSAPTGKNCVLTFESGSFNWREFAPCETSCKDSSEKFDEALGELDILNQHLDYMNQNNDWFNSENQMLQELLNSTAWLNDQINKPSLDKIQQLRITMFEQESYLLTEIDDLKQRSHGIMSIFNEIAPSTSNSSAISSEMLNYMKSNMTGLKQSYKSVNQKAAGLKHIVQETKSIIQTITPDGITAPSDPNQGSTGVGNTSPTSQQIKKQQMINSTDHLLQIMSDRQFQLERINNRIESAAQFIDSLTILD